MNVSAKAKFVVAAVAAGIVAVQVAVADGGFSSTDVVTVVLTVLGALGVYAVPNKSS
jgi:tellurite resistance protein